MRAHHLRAFHRTVLVVYFQMFPKVLSEQCHDGTIGSSLNVQLKSPNIAFALLYFNQFPLCIIKVLECPLLFP